MAVIRRSIVVDVSKVDKGLRSFDELAQNEVELYLNEKAKDLREYMYEKAPWQNRTWEARRGLKAEVENPREGYYRIALKHSAPHGKYLENAMERRFAILEPTARLMGPEVVNGMRGMLNK